MTPLPCSTNLSIHFCIPFRRPYGGLHQTNPVHVVVSPSSALVKCLVAGSQSTNSRPGDATSISNTTPIAVNTDGGVNHSVEEKSTSVLLKCRGLTLL